MNSENNLLIESSQQAIDAFRKLKKEEHSEIISKLEWCIGSYQNDGNHEGLLNYSIQSLDMLKTIKAANPRKVTKKVIVGLEKTLASYQQN